MPDVTASYGTLFDFITILGFFYTLLKTINVWTVVTSPNIHRLIVNNTHILLWRRARCATCYGRLSFLIVFFFLEILMFDIINNFIKQS